MHKWEKKKKDLAVFIAFFLLCINKSQNLMWETTFVVIKVLWRLEGHETTNTIQ